MNGTSIARLEELYPPLKLKGQQHMQLLMLKGIEVEIAQGLRTWPQQAALWQEGRNPDGSYIDPVHEAGVVTHAQAGTSFHNYGLAYDIDIVTTHGLDWTGTDELWVASIAVGESLGLTVGAEWHGRQQDRPHFQLTGGFGNPPDEEVLSLFKSGGLDAVWAELDKFYGIVK